MGKSPVGDFMIDLTWYTTVLSFLILLLRRVLKKKTMFDLLYRKRVKEIKQNIIYHNELDKIEQESPSLFNEIFDKTLSIIILINDSQYSFISKFTEISQFFNQFSLSQGINHITYEFILVNNNILDNSDLMYLQMQPNIRILTLKTPMDSGTAIQIGSFAAGGKFILYLSLSSPVQSLFKFINYFTLKLDDEYCTIIPMRQNCPQMTYLQRYLEVRHYIDQIRDFNFESFIISKKLAQVVIENIHFSAHYSFNLEFLMILKFCRIKAIEMPVEVDYSKQKLTFKAKIQSIFAVIGLVTARFLNLYTYSFRLPSKSSSNNESFFSRIDQ